VAFRVAPALREKTIDYLREREQVTSVYIETWRQVDLMEPQARRVRALAFGVDRGHVQYAGKLPLDKQLHLVRIGHGRSGANRDYVLSTVEALEALGIHDRDLHLLAQSLKGVRDPAGPRAMESGEL
jgi:cation transport protein ChaC